MMSFTIDVVLLVALVLTSIRVGLMHRELRRLRGYQVQYVQVFGETSRAADAIGSALNRIGGDGREVLDRLEAAIDSGAKLCKRIEDMARAAEPRRADDAASDDVGTYSRRPETKAPQTPDSVGARNEILKFAVDSRRLQDRQSESGSEAGSLPQRIGRELRFAPSVKTVRASGGNG